MVYSTPFESHTCRTFTPITLENLEAISHLPYHPDFPAPPNWPGGRGVVDDVKGRRIISEMKASGQQPKPFTLVKKNIHPRSRPGLERT